MLGKKGPVKLCFDPDTKGIKLMRYKLSGDSQRFFGHIGACQHDLNELGANFGIKGIYKRLFMLKKNLSKWFRQLL